MKKKCVIIPAYNEGNNIEALIGRIKAATDADIIVIDDGSGDGTETIARQAGAYVICHPFNLGYSVALQTGYKFAYRNKYDLLLQMDGDGQHPADSIPAFFDRLESGACDVLIGSRFLEAGRYQIGAAKNAAIGFFKLIIRMVNGAEISDPTSGFQCMSSRVYGLFTADRFLSDYPDANIIIRLHRMGFRIAEMPVKMAENPDGRSMHKGTFKILYYFFTTLLSIFIALISEKEYSSEKEAKP